MIGLIIVVAFGAYLAISCVVVWLVIRWARKTGRGVKRWAAAAILAMYLLVFWDHIPTLVLYKYYCATKAGFWVYKTPEQWKAENPGVAETLTWRENAQQFKNADGSWGFNLNQRFIWEEQNITSPFVPVHLQVEEIKDLITNEILIKRVSVWSGYRGGKEYLRFWTSLKPCIPNKNEFSSYLRGYHRLGRELK